MRHGLQVSAPRRRSKATLDFLAMLADLRRTLCAIEARIALYGPEAVTEKERRFAETARKAGL